MTNQKESKSRRGKGGYATYLEVKPALRQTLREVVPTFEDRCEKNSISRIVVKLLLLSLFGDELPLGLRARNRNIPRRN